ncbi:MAG: DinB family protein [Chitinophagaceae bacterium]|nr:DinB family protein [Chitinophagaceae bacterium]
MISRQEVIVPEFATKYFEATTHDDVTVALTESTKQFKKLLKKIPKKKIDYAYAEGKWTIRESLQHIIDAEKVFSFRAMWFARQDVSPLPGFDETSWAFTSKASRRNWKDMMEEFFAIRNSTQIFFGSLDDEQLKTKGTAGNNQVNVVGLGFICAGHVVHHIRIIKERYLSQMKSEA